MTRRGLAVALSLGLTLSGCGGPPPGHGTDAGSEVQQEASVRIGDVTVRANAVATATLGEAVARQYGIERDDGSVLLLVGVRRGADAQETALPARITATATNLLGKRQAIAMREVRSGEFIDYVGIASVIAPDTLRFDVEVVPQPGPRTTLQFNRDFFAQ
jgi:uncharacterized protein DUF4426